MNREIPIEKLRELLAYDAETGVLTWKRRPDHAFKKTADAAAWNTKYADKPALTTQSAYGYRIGTIHGIGFRAHRVAWALHTGAWPVQEIDHINGVKSDNRFANLRQVSSKENSRNKPMPAHNSSGAVGVFWSKAAGKWFARVKVNCKQIHLGTFDSFDAARNARLVADQNLGFHPNHGRSR